jgi:hypothetical protein
MASLFKFWRPPFSLSLRSYATDAARTGPANKRKSATENLNGITLANLPATVSAKDLTNLLGAYGKIKSVAMFPRTRACSLRMSLHSSSH